MVVVVIMVEVQAGAGVAAAVVPVLVVVLMLIVLMVMLMVVVMFIVVVMMLVVMVVVMAAAAVVVIVLDAVLLCDLRHQLVGQGVAAGHGLDDLSAGELIPGGGEDGGLLVVLPQQLHSGLQLGGVHALGAGQEDGAGVLHLVVEELTEVLHVDAGLGGVYHGDEAAQVHLVGHLVLHPLHGGDDVGQLAHAGGLDDDAVGGVLGQHLAQGRAEVAHQGAADAAGVHLGDLHAGVLQKAAVDADLAELVLNEHDLFALEGLLQQLLDEGGLARPKETGDNVDLSHNDHPFRRDIQIMCLAGAA